MSTLPPIDLSPTPLPASSGVVGDIGVTALTQQDVLALFDRFLPESYLAPMKEGLGDGYETFEAYALLWARVSFAVQNLAQSNYLLAASLGAAATGSVNFSRAVGGPAVTLATGTLLQASASGRLFRTTAPATLTLGSTGPVSAPVVAITQGFQGNVKGQFVLPNGAVIPGEIDTIVLPFQTPGLADPTIVVTQPQDLSGGLPAALEQLASDRGITRAATEPQSHFRARSRALPDTVSPAAFRRVLTDVTSALHGTFQFIETFQVNYQTCWDAPPNPIAASPTYNPTLFVYDDPRVTATFQDRWLDENDHAGGVIVVLPAYVAILETSMGYDDTGTSQGDFQTLLGLRATSAYDIPEVAPGVVTPPGAYDGYDLSVAAVYQGVQTVMEQIKAGGVSTALEVQGG